MRPPAGSSRLRRANTPARVFLHIGSPVTGARYLRGALAAHRRRLTRAGVLYPSCHVGDDAGHLDAVLDVMSLATRAHERTSGAWERLAQGARDWRRGTVVLSHELMSDADEHQVERIVGSFDGSEVHAVYAAADLARQIPRAWTQWTCSGGTAEFATYVDLLARNHSHRLSRVFWRSHDVERVLRRWTAFLPPARIHVVTSPAGPDGDRLLWNRFARTVGIDPLRFGVPGPAAPESLTLPAAEVVRLLNLHVEGRIDPDATGGLVRRLAAVPGPEPRVPTRHAQWLLDEADRIISAVKSSGYDVRGDITDLRPEPSAFSDGDESTCPAPADVIEAQSRLLAAVTKLDGDEKRPAGLRRRALPLPWNR